MTGQTSQANEDVFTLHNHPAGRMFDTPALWDHKPMDEPITTHDILV